MTKSDAGTLTLPTEAIVRPLRRGVITATDIRRFCVATDNPDPVYLDDAAARAAGYGGIIAPPLCTAAVTRPSPWRGNLLADGQYDDLAPPGFGHLQSIAASQEWEFFRPAIVGEEIVEEVRLGAPEAKQGRSGTMYLVKEESLISTVAGDPIVRSVMTIIFRPHPAQQAETAEAEAIAAPIPAPSLATTRAPGLLIKRPDMVSLFMFAACIWATHRIHWDEPYSRSEGLPGAVIPGWMLSAYLCELVKAEQPAGAVLSKLSVRYQALAVPGDVLTCKISTGEGVSGLGLSLSNQAGVEVLSGRAEFRF